MIFQDIHLGMFARSTLGNYPTLCFQTYRFFKLELREFLTDRDTEVVIEGFPRSANGFTVYAFKSTQPKAMKIAHHLHLPAQVIRGVQFKIPTLVLIRRPKAAIGSFLTYMSTVSNQDIPIHQALQMYISYYQALLRYKSEILIVPFEEVIHQYPKVIKRMNDKFGTNFAVPDKSVVEQLATKWKNSKSGLNSDASTFNSTVQAQMDDSKYQLMLHEAQDIYLQFVAPL